MNIDLTSIAGITADSRDVKNGYLFAALPGSNVNGVNFIPQAITNGAKYILAPIGTTLPDSNQNVQLIEDSNILKRFSLIACEYFAKQPDTIVAVTGTSGKTSTVYFAQQICNALGYNAASLGTLGIHSDKHNNYGSLTTPDPVSLYKTLRQVSEDGITHLAMEASSHGLHQHRLDGVKIKAAGFTSFSRDHMDYHPSVEHYFESKKRLFTEILEQNGTAVLNADISEFQNFKDLDKNTLSYGKAAPANAIKINSISSGVNAQKLSLSILGIDYEIDFPLIGEFQVYNALCAFGLVISGNVHNSKYVRSALKALETLKPVPGRLQNILGHPKGAQIIVDYAHKPGALEQVIKTLRPITKNRLICVFGCGGDRDQGKRAEMGNISERLADITIVTDDNPRSETPEAIRSMIMKAAPSAEEIPDRRKAIQHSISIMENGDVLVIAGKGHETGQIFANHTEEFCDVTEVHRSLKNLKGE